MRRNAALYFTAIGNGGWTSDAHVFLAFYDSVTTYAVISYIHYFVLFS